MASYDVDEEIFREADRRLNGAVAPRSIHTGRVGRPRPAPETPERAAEAAREFAEAAKASIKRNLAAWRRASLAQQQAIVKKHVAHLFFERFGVKWQAEWSRWYTAPTPPSWTDGVSPRSRLVYWLDRRPPVQLRQQPLGSIDPRGPTPQDRFWSPEEYTWTSVMVGNWPLHATTADPCDVLLKETEAIKKALAKFGQSSTSVSPIRRGPRVDERRQQKKICE